MKKVIINRSRTSLMCRHTGTDRIIQKFHCKNRKTTVQQAVVLTRWLKRYENDRRR